MIDGKVYTAIATPNIALIKYWGKRDEKLILPTNSSISMTMGEEFNTKTSIMFTDKIDEDAFYINGTKQDLSDKDIKERFAIIDILRNMAGTRARAMVVSENSFPTAAGLASSASGIAAMVFAANAALELNLDTRSMSIIARQGSGSSCRSLAGGFVKWERGTKDDGTDSYIRQIAPSSHWPDLIDIVSIVSKSKKKVSSRAGMKQTVESSVLYQARSGYVEKACTDMENAIISKDFEKLGLMTIRDSNNMHAVMLDTYPPILYLNDVSRGIISAIDNLNVESGKIIAAYTFDAGPNAQILTLEKYKGSVEKALSEIEGIEKTYVTKPGNGPRILDSGEPLIEGLNPRVGNR
ncbi:MAG: diphosphomevalonate decarboxylase [Candidatus Micrarchaeaceae archaeon]|jgi:diphosphomevalonate decarboxylase